jgi:hypothetical protein
MISIQINLDSGEGTKTDRPRLALQPVVPMTSVPGPKSLPSNSFYVRTFCVSNTELGAGVIYGAVCEIENLFLIQLLSGKICDANLRKFDDYAIHGEGPYCKFQCDFW